MICLKIVHSVILFLSHGAISHMIFFNIPQMLWVCLRRVQSSAQRGNRGLIYRERNVNMHVKNDHRGCVRWTFTNTNMQNRLKEEKNHLNIKLAAGLWPFIKVECSIQGRVIVLDRVFILVKLGVQEQDFFLKSHRAKSKHILSRDDLRIWSK